MIRTGILLYFLLMASAALSVNSKMHSPDDQDEGFSVILNQDKVSEEIIELWVRDKHNNYIHIVPGEFDGRCLGQAQAAHKSTTAEVEKSSWTSWLKTGMNIVGILVPLAITGYNFYSGRPSIDPSLASAFQNTFGSAFIERSQADLDAALADLQRGIP